MFIGHNINDMEGVSVVYESQSTISIHFPLMRKDPNMKLKFLTLKNGVNLNQYPSVLKNVKLRKEIKEEVIKIVTIHVNFKNEDVFIKNEQRMYHHHHHHLVELAQSDRAYGCWYPGKMNGSVIKSVICLSIVSMYMLACIAGSHTAKYVIIDNKLPIRISGIFADILECLKQDLQIKRCLCAEGCPNLPRVNKFYFIISTFANFYVGKA
ncbi:hypothetical protein GQR58_007289 [Nymphon striatum]|nr:hypothetical protein GQR58_007289 [Nymphon striatum]